MLLLVELDGWRLVGLPVWHTRDPPVCGNQVVTVGDVAMLREAETVCTVRSSPVSWSSHTRVLSSSCHHLVEGYTQAL